MVQQKTDLKRGKIDKNEKGTEKQDYSYDKAADFETAITATGFGKFNIILFIIALPSTWSSEFDFTSTSYVLPAAQCDLELTLVNKGMLNAITYLGTVTSAFLWGYLADTLGRRKLLIFGFFTDAVFVILSSFSQNFWFLLVVKFMNGFVICGPYAILMSFISEFHSARYRAPILILSGIFFSLANLTLSGLAWFIIPRTFSYSLFDGSIYIHSWQVFLMVCSIPHIISGIAHLFLPESPKFLMTAGRNEEALQVFQRVYSINTGLPPTTFPIKTLVDETKQTKIMKGEEEKKVQTSGWSQIKPMFSQPFLIKIVHIYVVLFLGLLGENTLRLWLPQLFTKMDEYNQAHNYSTSASLCEMLDMSSPDNATLVEDICTVVAADKQVYINTIVVAISNCLGFIIVSSVVNIIGKKWILVMIYAACGFSGVSNYWSTSSSFTLFLVSIHGGFASVATSTMISFIVDVFPTTLRTMTISLGMMFGRMGSIIGNIMFPILLQTGCLPPFLLIGGTALGCATLSLLLPNIKMKSLD